MVPSNLDHTIIDVLRRRATQTPDHVAYRFLDDGTGDRSTSCTYRELWVHVRTASAWLRELGLAGRRVVLAMPPGIDHVATFFGALHAGATVVPAPAPTGRRAAGHLSSIMHDCDAAAVVAKSGHLERFNLLTGDTPRPVRRLSPEWMDAEWADAAELTPAVVTDPAVVQYSSGSTGQPKGVILKHEHLMSNGRVLTAHIGEEPDRVGLTWLPPHHDMGLIGTIVFALHGGWPLVIMAPEHFAQQPYRWLRAIGEHRVTISVTPAFALDLCTRSVTDEELSGLDLSSLRHLFCGSDQLFPHAVTSFTDRFAPYGYREQALIPCYGLAEATLFVSGRVPGSPLVVHDGITSCGVLGAGHELRITDPDTGTPVPDEVVGEIRVHGPNVAEGYLDRPEDTARSFPGDGWLRTGDLGFRHHGELFVTGRLSGMIVVNGRNIQPQDIERTVNAAHDLVRRSVAFGVAVDGAEAVVVVAELRSYDVDVAGVRAQVLAAVAAEHGVRPADVRFVSIGSIPTTTSGKLRRNAAQRHYLTGVTP
ncbi:fatty acyl-AMP ligase [Lentzea sp. NPDC004782]|uniref:fatty acyl-AMP ligase n=1 Tax=Lentzea sp. NPDC004782 TaxID=3154458 RepID=UPI0033A555AE